MAAPAFQLGAARGEPQEEIRVWTLSEAGPAIPQLPPSSVAVAGRMLGLR